MQKRENDLVLGTFGRGFYVLDDYSPLREVTPEALAREAELFPLRRVYRFDELTYPQAAWGNYDDAESAVRRDVHLSRRRRASRQSRADDRR